MTENFASPLFPVCLDQEWSLVLCAGEGSGALNHCSRNTMSCLFCALLNHVSPQSLTAHLTPGFRGFVEGIEGRRGNSQCSRSLDRQPGLSFLALGAGFLVTGFFVEGFLVSAFFAGNFLPLAARSSPVLGLRASNSNPTFPSSPHFR